MSLIISNLLGIKLEFSFFKSFVLVITFLLVYPSQAFSQELKNSISWENLPNHIKNKNLSLVESNLIDCPYVLDEKQSNIITLQWIENTFYKWKEFSLNSKEICILLLKPKRKFLSKDEAKTLLTASQLWMTENTPAKDDAIILDSSESSLKGLSSIVRFPNLDDNINLNLNKTVSSPILNLGDTIVKTLKHDSVIDLKNQESVIDSDGRSSVNNTTAYPWSTISYISLLHSDGEPYRGTAFLVSPYVALTNGHIVYNRTLSSWNTNVKIFPGQYQNGTSVIRPYGERVAYRTRTNNNYITEGGVRNDYGAIVFTEPFSGITTFMPLRFGFDMDNDSTKLNNAGYPGTAQNRKTRTQWHDSDYSSSRTTNHIARYWMDTSGGNSGGPVWLFSGGLRYVVAIHAFGYGGTLPNGGPRLTSDNQAIIESWIGSPPPSISLSESVDNLATSFSTSSWYGQANTYYYGNDAAQSGSISNDASTSMQTTVNGPGIVSFYWKVSSETEYDTLTFFINNSVQESISGFTNWTKNSFYVSSGQNILKWKYSKDSSVSSGSDAGWVDKLVFKHQDFSMVPIITFILDN